MFHVEVIGGHEIYEIKNADGPSIWITEKLPPEMSMSFGVHGMRKPISDEPSATYLGVK